MELRWTPAQFWHSAWHEFHAAVSYLADVRRREAEAWGKVGSKRGGNQIRVKGKSPFALGRANGAAAKEGDRFTIRYPDRYHEGSFSSLYETAARRWPVLVG